MANEKSMLRKKLERIAKKKTFIWITGLIGTTGLLILGGVVIFGALLLMLYAAFTPLISEEAELNRQQEATQSVIGGQLPATVLAHKEAVEKELKEQGIADFHLNILLAIMAQESGGRGNDVFQASESLGKPVNTLSVEESIKQGVKHYYSIAKRVGMTEKYDSEKVKVILQSYNFGIGYLDFINKNHGGKYSLANAKAFSNQQAKIMGWSSYGDVNYVSNVMRYFNTANGSFVSIDDINNNFPTPNPSSYSSYHYFGQCTYFVDARRKEVGAPLPHGFGDAWMWTHQAKNLGLKTGNTPKKGSAVVWQRNQFGMDSYYGHVAFVEDVKENGDFVVSEMNMKGINVLSYRVIPAEQAPSLTFIY